MNSFLHLVDQDTLLIVCTVVLFVMYTWYVCTVITQIKSQYKLSCLKSYMIHSDIALMNLPVIQDKVVLLSHCADYHIQTFFRSNDSTVLKKKVIRSVSFIEMDLILVPKSA
ncbi:hypothetical protein JH06_1249 [Blastocystis sp. subtype 4]|uniref:hypothetical protein n=1 Tax=Blastocystis sp. subtype 4 TaxID=944170 RepID=UPI00071141CA|nr:hypothetical protein JH06_1249 [Blastocystis sp. subtype 4]KNB45211.1 hypothetical protein JH06_1249 [Blastocystis sp. subtype 4]|eukprot:XP_014528654.1 hypothetical protein JH06_1249 [Blastocystis sp. subtype 4]